nr:MAG: hypothetical protein [Betatorquevirus sp.]
MGNGGRGKTKRDISPAPAAARAPKTPQAATPPAPKKIKICAPTINLFGDCKPKNRRFTPKEYEQELQEAKIWDRPPRQFIFDIPFYYNTVPEPVVNFALNYKF